MALFIFYIKLSLHLIYVSRGKKKRMRMMMPIFIIIKLFLITLASGAFVTIATLAIKALLAGTLSLLLAGYDGLSSFFTPSRTVHATEVISYPTVNEWPSSMYSYDQDIVGSYNEPAPQHQLLTGHQFSSKSHIDG
ncbi:hypothetical protein FQA39_LY14795 [Lamprigera yunnana]|nr:hypothetical protein FQA39_LY14795 [Lamprigera yunnana]